MALQMGSPALRKIFHEVPFFLKVEGLLAEVQADWEDRKCFLLSKPLAGTRGLLLSLQPWVSGNVSPKRLRKLVKPRSPFSLESLPSPSRACSDNALSAGWQGQPPSNQRPYSTLFPLPDDAIEHWDRRFSNRRSITRCH